jgi:hypothetical protein
MSKVSELSYDIQELFIEGYSPKSIAVQLGCPVEMVYDWLESNSIDPEEDETQQGDYFGA